MNSQAKTQRVSFFSEDTHFYGAGVKRKRKTGLANGLTMYSFLKVIFLRFKS
ncbi:hypothetical protein SAMN05421852_12058 [Thermoflavimicrobium dichotomicum]|uniref:Uncharacterized protein n=1 Tax=Thermoflavimicrobium dichotomicum TaxID=46223 RepID=A0A1I3TZA3_9BACL|nr:hypothetical protein SAMN05421852_12058 [Thermoflavimicrobium dichotomicum]